MLSTAAALCLGTAVPASAHSLGSSSDRDAAKTTSAPTVAQLQAWVDSFIAKRQQQLSAFASKIAADPKLTDAQQADFAAKLAKQQSVLSNLKNAVDSASTVEAVHQAIRSAMAADGVHGNFGWCGFFGRCTAVVTACTAPTDSPGTVPRPSTAGPAPITRRPIRARSRLQPVPSGPWLCEPATTGQPCNRTGRLASTGPTPATASTTARAIYQARHDAGGFASQSGRHHR